VASRRRRPDTLPASAEFLRRTEEFHHFVSGRSAHVRIGSPHYEALTRLTTELRAAYCAISGEETVPWSHDTGTMRQPRPWEE
jgi:hypothetical protein